jgi:hypothetical protein
MYMARKSYKSLEYVDDDEYSTSKKIKERDKKRRQQRLIRNALKSKDLSYLLELEDDY